MPLRHSFLTVLFLVVCEEAVDEIILLNLLGLHLIEYMRFRGLLFLVRRGLVVDRDVGEDRQSAGLAKQLLERRLESLLVGLQGASLIDLLHLRHCDSGIRLQLLTVVGRPPALALCVQELAAQPVGTVEVLMVLLAQLRLVIRWNVLLPLQFVSPVCEGTLLIYY